MTNEQAGSVGPAGSQVFTGQTVTPERVVYVESGHGPSRPGNGWGQAAVVAAAFLGAAVGAFIAVRVAEHGRHMPTPGSMSMGPGYRTMTPAAGVPQSGAVMPAPPAGPPENAEPPAGRPGSADREGPSPRRPDDRRPPNRGPDRMDQDGPPPSDRGQGPGSGGAGRGGRWGGGGGGRPPRPPQDGRPGGDPRDQEGGGPDRRPAKRPTDGPHSPPPR